MAIIAIADVKTHLSVSDTALDTVLTPVVAAVDFGVKKYCGRLLEQTAITGEKHVGDTRIYLDLKEYPLVSVQQLKIGGTIIATGSSSWEIFDLKAARLYRPSGWDLPSNAGQQNIDVNYTAGYAAASDELKLIKLAAIEWAAARFRVRNKVEFRTEAFSDHSADFWADMPGDTKRVLDMFKRVYS